MGPESSLQAWHKSPRPLADTNNPAKVFKENPPENTCSAKGSVKGSAALKTEEIKIFLSLSPTWLDAQAA